MVIADKKGSSNQPAPNEESGTNTNQGWGVDNKKKKKRRRKPKSAAQDNRFPTCPAVGMAGKRSNK